MAQQLVISVPHTLGKEEVRRRLEPGLSSLIGEASILTVVDESWEDDELKFRVRALGQLASGTVQVADDQSASPSCFRGCCSGRPVASKPPSRRAAGCCWKIRAGHPD
jgi:hypothetical protein